MNLFDPVWPSSIPLVVPIVPTVDVVAFPQMIIPLLIIDPKIIAGVQAAFDSGKKFILVVACKNIMENIDTISEENFFSVGTIANIIRIINLQNGNIKILIQGLIRSKITSIKNETHLLANISLYPNNNTNQNSSIDYLSSKIECIKNIANDLIDLDITTKDFTNFLSKTQNPDKVIDYIISHLAFSVNDSQRLLESSSYDNFFEIVAEILIREYELSKLTQKVKNKAKESINNAQKEFYIREQIKALREEIGEESLENNNYLEQLEKIKEYINTESYKELLRNINRFDSMSLESAESGVLKNYLDCVFDLPWNTETIDNTDIINAKNILDNEHYGLHEAKERILDFLSVKFFSKNNFSTIICFHGPPGTGKTSLAQSIAHALNRKFFRIAVGGMRDESEIRGHRRTYVGAMPGRIIKGIKQVQSKNPIIIIDEIDKIGSDYKGDPSSALLEVLDYQQNNSFYDYYLGIPFDLSHCFFITTANRLDTIPHALRDRMELIEIPSYSLEEKYNIAKKFIIPRTLKKTGLKEDNLNIDTLTIKKIIERYTYEAGVRDLDRIICKLCSRLTRLLLEEKKSEDLIINTQTIEEFLGAPKYEKTRNTWNNKIGLSNGLCWTPCGGEVLTIESILLPGKGKLILTGQLGEVMKESAQVAFNLLYAYRKNFNIENTLFIDNDIHIHFPAGAIPKDGPSAGFAIFISLYSLFTKTLSINNIAMTGEIDLNGNILPVGGIKEKVLAAQREGIKKILLPLKNKPDFSRISEYIEEANVVFIDNIHEGIKEIFSQEGIIPLIESFADSFSSLFDKEITIEETENKII